MHERNSHLGDWPLSFTSIRIIPRSCCNRSDSQSRKYTGCASLISKKGIINESKRRKISYYFLILSIVRKLLCISKLMIQNEKLRGIKFRKGHGTSHILLFLPFLLFMFINNEYLNKILIALKSPR